MLKSVLLRLLYRTGLLRLYHLFRNRDVLTVIALHRVLAEDDPRWRTCDPLYTVSARLFEQYMQFLAAHYSVVSLNDLMRSRTSAGRLPPRPLLITFDDGWADNHRYAQPILHKLGLPAVLFAAADVIDRRDAFFQERIIGAWRAGRLDSETLSALWRGAGEDAGVPTNPGSETSVRALIARLQKLSLTRRAEVLAAFAELLADDERQMLTTEELRELAAGGFEIGTHGKTHEALTAVADVDAELHESRSIVARALGVSPKRVVCLSFPFSMQNAVVVERARVAGYDLLFGGGATVTPLARAVPDLLARVSITAQEACDQRGELRPEALAAYLFRRPHRALEPG